MARYVDPVLHLHKRKPRSDTSASRKRMKKAPEKKEYPGEKLRDWDIAHSYWGRPDTYKWDNDTGTLTDTGYRDEMGSTPPRGTADTRWTDYYDSDSGIIDPVLTEPTPKAKYDRAECALIHEQWRQVCQIIVGIVNQMSTMDRNTTEYRALAGERLIAEAEMKRIKESYTAAGCGDLPDWCPGAAPQIFDEVVPHRWSNTPKVRGPI